MSAGYYPIIYVRGYAATQGEIDEAADDPFSGFNLGSTVHRPNARTAWPEEVAFEGPLVRLINDHGYIDAVESGKHNQLPSSFVHGIDPARTIWIFRYYDNVSSRFKNKASTRDEMTEMGRKLYDFVGEVRQKTGSSRVHLVAHSMGGLICRCLIQKIYPQRKREAPEEDTNGRNVREIARLFTYATPHNGIESQYGPLDYIGGFFTALGVLGSDVFRRDNMHRFLTDQFAPRNFSPNEITELSPNDVCCLVGTNSADYPVAKSLSRRLIGPASDGLVLTRNAFIRGAARLHLHRSHSGPFGIVNSEEAYHHLANFLFGGVLVLDLGSGDVAPDPADGEKRLQADIAVARADGAELSSDASREKFCPVKLPEDFQNAGDHILLALPVPNFSPSAPLSYRIKIGFYLSRPSDREGRFLTPDWVGLLHLHCERTSRSWLSWQGEPETGEPHAEVFLPESFKLFSTRLKLKLSWREHPEAWPQGVRAKPPVKTDGGGATEELEAADLIDAETEEEEKPARHRRRELGHSVGA